ncbi:hypothetical protein GTW38_36550, partial [Streptomyces sp. SID7804]
VDGGPPHVYVVPGRADAAERVEEVLHRTGHGTARVTAVSTLPLRDDGAVDTDALRALPTADRTAAEAWRDRLARLPGVTG